MLPRWVGRRVDDFIVEDRIGRGGMATVYRARQVSVNRFVALKIIDLSPNQEEREEFRKRFAQEATVVALLEHIHKAVRKLQQPSRSQELVGFLD